MPSPGLDLLQTGGVWIAVNGCMHGELDLLYAAVRAAEDRAGIKVALLISCGDFQATRNRTDLECLACPPKYRRLNDFHKYYAGERVAPVTTLFIGGNHEASNFMQELPCGGWVAPNIFYMGYACVVEFAGLRIGGMSGIFNARHYQTPHFERSPYTPNTLRSVYHIRQVDVFRMGLLERGSANEAAGGASASTEPRRLDVFLSHDWPQGIAFYGNVHELVRKKSYFKREIGDGSLGSPPMAHLLHTLRPRYWFSAHLHVKFAAVVNHSASAIAGPSDTQQFDPMSLAAPSNKGGGSEPVVTRFLALDKAIPGKKFLQLLSLDGDNGGGASGGTSAAAAGGAGGVGGAAAAGAAAAAETSGAKEDSGDNNTDDADRDVPKIRFDSEWLAILRATHHLWNATNFDQTMVPGHVAKVQESRKWLKAKAAALAQVGGGDLYLPHPFERAERTSLQLEGNAQMDHFLDVIGCDHVVTIPLGGASPSAPSSGKSGLPPQVNMAPPSVPLPLLHKAGPTLVPASVLTSAVRSRYGASSTMTAVRPSKAVVVDDPDEIDLSDDDDDGNGSEGGSEKVDGEGASGSTEASSTCATTTIVSVADPDAIDIGGDY
jgi:hypothetical protein